MHHLTIRLSLNDFLDRMSLGVIFDAMEGKSRGESTNKAARQLASPGYDSKKMWW